MLAAGIEPVFLVVELLGAEYLRPQLGGESLSKFHTAVADAIVSAARGGAALSYDDTCIIGILPGPDRLKTFALIEKLRRALPIQAQSFDCVLQPDFDVLEYDPGTGIGGVMAQVVTRRLMATREAA